MHVKLLYIQLASSLQFKRHAYYNVFDTYFCRKLIVKTIQPRQSKTAIAGTRHEIEGSGEHAVSSHCTGSIWSGHTTDTFIYAVQCEQEGKAKGFVSSASKGRRYGPWTGWIRGSMSWLATIFRWCSLLWKPIFVMCWWWSVISFNYLALICVGEDHILKAWDFDSHHHPGLEQSNFSQVCGERKH